MRITYLSLKSLIFLRLNRRRAHVLVAQVENKSTGISVFVPLSPTSALGLVGVVLMAIEKQIDGCKRFDVLEVSRQMELHVTLSVEAGGKRELREVQPRWKSLM